METTHDFTTEERAIESLIVPFEPVTIRRHLKVFASSAGLTPGVTSIPNDDFLANLVSGKRSFLAIVRRTFGTDFRNFLNYSARGAERTTPEVRARLIACVGGKEEILTEIAMAAREGMLAAKLGKLVKRGEGVLFRFMRAAMSKKLLCPHCQKNMITAPAEWWARQQCDLAEPEYRFVDRILYDVLAATLLPLILATPQEREERAVGLANLCSPGAHMFGHWLTMVCAAYRAPNLAALQARARLKSVTPDSLYRFGRGEMITFEAIAEITKELPRDRWLAQLGIAARGLAFAADAIQAAHRGAEELDHETAQQILRARLMQMKNDLRLSFVTKLLPAGPPHAELPAG